MKLSKLNRAVPALLGIGVLTLLIIPALVSAQQATPNPSPEIRYNNVRIAGYSKITASIRGISSAIHVTGKGITLELRENQRALHRLQADDIRVVRKNDNLTADLTGNLHYTLLPLPEGSKQVEGTADSAVYKQSGKGEDGAITLTQAHLMLYADTDRIADLKADQAIASRKEETITCTGKVQIAVKIEGHQATLTADNLTWDRRANIVQATGNVHLAYTGPNGQAASANGGHIKIDLKTQEFEAD